MDRGTRCLLQRGAPEPRSPQSLRTVHRRRAGAVVRSRCRCVGDAGVWRRDGFARRARRQVVGQDDFALEVGRAEVSAVAVLAAQGAVIARALKVVAEVGRHPFDGPRLLAWVAQDLGLALAGLAVTVVAPHFPAAALLEAGDELARHPVRDALPVRRLLVLVLDMAVLAPHPEVVREAAHDGVDLALAASLGRDALVDLGQGLGRGFAGLLLTVADEVRAAPSEPRRLVLAGRLWCGRRRAAAGPGHGGHDQGDGQAVAHRTRVSRS